MKVHLSSVIQGLLLLCLFSMIHSREASSQVRPGIRPFVKAPEGCSVSEPVDTENLYSLTLAEIQALYLARAGERANLQLPPDAEGRTQQMAKTMAGLRQQRIGYTCAGFVLSPYANSKIESAATAVKYMVHAYDELGRMTDEVLGITMRSSMRNNHAASTRSELSELGGKRREVVENMIDALNVNLSLLLDKDHPDPEGKQDLVLLTREQRLSIMDYLYSRFPTLKGEKGINESDDFTRQAAVIQAFLTGGFKTTKTVTAK